MHLPDDRFWPRLCKNIFERDRYTKQDWKSRIWAKSTSDDVPINFRFHVDARTSFLTERFYTLWAESSPRTGVHAAKICHTASTIQRGTLR